MNSNSGPLSVLPFLHSVMIAACQRTFSFHQCFIYTLGPSLPTPVHLPVFLRVLAHVLEFSSVLTFLSSPFP